MRTRERQVWNAEDFQALPSHERDALFRVGSIRDLADVPPVLQQGPMPRATSSLTNDQRLVATARGGR